MRLELRVQQSIYNYVHSPFESKILASPTLCVHPVIPEWGG